MIENNDMRGRLTLRLTDAGGRVVHETRCANRIVTAGRQLVAELFTGQGATPISHIAVGTDGTAAADAQTGLSAERAPRKAISTVELAELVEKAGTPDEVHRVRVALTAVFDFGEANGAAPLREAGIFNTADGGDMYNRVVFEPVTKTDAFKLTLLWDVVF